LFALEKELGHLTLPFVSHYVIFQHNSYGKALNIHEQIFCELVKDISSKYRNQKDVPYHNAIHAADVLCTHYYFLNSEVFSSHSLLHKFASLVAAICHDVDHDGYNNRFHVNAGSELAVRYNDNAVLENHHASLGWQKVKEHHLLKEMSKQDIVEFRRTFVSCILGTDMVQHEAHMVHLRELSRLSKIIKAQEEANEAIDEKTLEEYKTLKEEALPLSVHSADISNVAKPYDITVCWVERLMEEFFSQGDKEESLGLSISPLCDQLTTHIPKSEALYIKFLVLPWYKTWNEITGCEVAVKHLESNYKKYVQISEDMPLKKPEDGKILTERKSLFVPRKERISNNTHSESMIDISDVVDIDNISRSMNAINEMTQSKSWHS